MADLPNVVPALPELFLALVIMALLMLGVFQKDHFVAFLAQQAGGNAS